MVEIRRFGPLRHLRADAVSHVLRYDRGRVTTSRRGATFWFLPLSTSVAELPVDDRVQSFIFHGRSADFQDVVAQGSLTYRIVDPPALAERVDFSVDLLSGAHLKQPIERITAFLTERAERRAAAYLSATEVRRILAEGQVRLREEIEAAFAQDEELGRLGLAVVAVSVTSVKPKPELEKALEAPTRERIQQKADEAAFARRAQAVEKERAIQENELQNRIELARREEQLISQNGQNTRRQATEQAEASRIAADAKAARIRLQGEVRAESVKRVEGARVEVEADRMALYRDMPPSVLLGLAAQALAGRLDRIEHLSISPDLLGPALLNLLSAGARRLEGPDQR
jgi:regulator of protease activity HflC (stomatin/prohibitin superfamily)